MMEVGGVARKSWRAREWMSRLVCGDSRYETSGRSGTEVHFSNIHNTFLGFFAGVSVNVVGGGFRGSHTRHVRLSLPQLHIFHRRYLLCILSCAAST